MWAHQGVFWSPKDCVAKMAQPDFPNGKFRFFPRRALWLGGGGAEGDFRGRGPPPLAFCCSKDALGRAGLRPLSPPWAPPRRPARAVLSHMDSRARHPLPPCRNLTGPRRQPGPGLMQPLHNAGYTPLALATPFPHRTNDIGSDTGRIVPPTVQKTTGCAGDVRATCGQHAGVLCGSQPLPQRPQHPVYGGLQASLEKVHVRVNTCRPFVVETVMSRLSDGPWPALSRARGCKSAICSGNGHVASFRRAMAGLGRARGCKKFCVSGGLSAPLPQPPLPP